MSIHATWQRLEDWLSQNALGSTLPSGAAPDEIERAQGIMGVQFPDDLRESYLLHNGSGGIRIFEHGLLLPLFPTVSPRVNQSVVNTWELMRDILAEPGTPSDSWDVAWIPIVDNECGDHLIIDSLPSAVGGAGNVLLWWHETSLVANIAPSFHDLLATRVADLESGECSFEAQWRTIRYPRETGEIPRSRFRPHRR